MDAAAGAATGLAGERLPHDAGLLAGVAAALAFGGGGVAHQSPPRRQLITRAPCGAR